MRILFEDEYLIAIDKPRGIASERGPGASGEGAAEIVARQRAGSSARTPAWRPVYRLDVSTSGVLLLSKLRQAGERIREAYRNGTIRQEFVAVVRGRPSKRRMTLSPAEARGWSATAHQPAAPRDRARSKVARVSERPLVRATPEVEEQVVLELIESADRHALVRYGGARLKPVHVRLHLGSVRLTPIDNLLHLERVSFVHPLTRRRIRITSPIPVRFAQALQGIPEQPRAERVPADRSVVPITTRPTGPGWEHRLAAALAVRAPLLSDPQTNAIRILNGAADSMPGLAAEMFGDVLILQVFEGHAPDDEALLRSVGEWYRTRLNLRSVYVKRFVKARSHLPADSDPRLFDPNPLVGEPAPPEINVLENGLSFVIRPYDGYSVGLFLDQRDNRRRIRELSSGSRLLNLYAYTCGFSVAATAGGASETVSVDLSKRHLEWGKQNFAANGLSPDGHVFVRTDASEYLKRAARHGWHFDLIIIDPPTFARMKHPRRTFAITSGLQPLLEQAILVLKSGGHLLVSTNARELSTRWLATQITEATDRRRFRVIATPTLPLDFAGDPDFAKSLLVRFD